MTKRDEAIKTLSKYFTPTAINRGLDHHDKPGACQRCHLAPAVFRVVSDILLEHVCVKCAVTAEAIEEKQNKEWALPIEGRIKVEVL
jgi:hypothetical protein